MALSDKEQREFEKITAAFEKEQKGRARRRLHRLEIGSGSWTKYVRIKVVRFLTKEPSRSERYMTALRRSRRGVGVLVIGFAAIFLYLAHGLRPLEEAILPWAVCRAALFVGAKSAKLSQRTISLMRLIINTAFVTAVWWFETFRGRWVVGVAAGLWLIGVGIVAVVVELEAHFDREA